MVYTRAGKRNKGHITIRDQIITEVIHSFVQHAFLQQLVCVESYAGQYWGPRGDHHSHTPALPGLTVQWGRQNHPQMVTTRSSQGWDMGALRGLF